MVIVNERRVRSIGIESATDDWSAHIEDVLVNFEILDSKSAVKGNNESISDIFEISDSLGDLDGNCCVI